MAEQEEEEEEVPLPLLFLILALHMAALGPPVVDARLCDKI